MEGSVDVSELEVALNTGDINIVRLALAQGSKRLANELVASPHVLVQLLDLLTVGECTGKNTGGITPVDDALRAFAAGEFVVVVDAMDRENEGDLIIAAEHATEEKIAFMIEHTSGLICAPCDSSVLDRLNIPLMVTEVDNCESHGTAYTVSVDVLKDTTTGISAGDRARTLRALARSDSKGSDFAKPGHMFPLRARSGGIHERPGHTEASLELCRLCDLAPVAAICEITNKDGTMARLPELELFSQYHGLCLISIEDLLKHSPIA